MLATLAPTPSAPCSGSPSSSAARRGPALPLLTVVAALTLASEKVSFTKGESSRPRAPGDRRLGRAPDERTQGSPERSPALCRADRRRHPCWPVAWDWRASSSSLMRCAGDGRDLSGGQRPAQCALRGGGRWSAGSGLPCHSSPNTRALEQPNAPIGWLTPCSPGMLVLLIPPRCCPGVGRPADRLPDRGPMPSPTESKALLLRDLQIQVPLRGRHRAHRGAPGSPTALAAAGAAAVQHRRARVLPSGTARSPVARHHPSEVSGSSPCRFWAGARPRESWPRACPLIGPVLRAGWRHRPSLSLTPCGIAAASARLPWRRPGRPLRSNLRAGRP